MAVEGETVVASSTAGIDDTMKPITGTKSDNPAIRASNIAAGTWSHHSTGSVTANAISEVSELPAAYAKMTRSHSASVRSAFGRFSFETNASSQSRVSRASISR